MIKIQKVGAFEIHGDFTLDENVPGYWITVIATNGGGINHKTIEAPAELAEKQFNAAWEQTVARLKKRRHFWEMK